jgi:hypothetical protein
MEVVIWKDEKYFLRKLIEKKKEKKIIIKKKMK